MCLQQALQEGLQDKNVNNRRTHQPKFIKNMEVPFMQKNRKGRGPAHGLFQLPHL